MNSNNFFDQRPHGMKYGKYGHGGGYHHPHYKQHNYPHHGYNPVIINRPTGLPFLTGLATGAILSPGQPQYPAPPYQQPYPPYPYQQPYPPYPYQQPYPPYPYE